MKNKIFLLILTFSVNLFAETGYNREDLRFETANPLVDYPETVLNKKIEFKEKIDLAFYKETITDEMFFSGSIYSLKAGYHLDDFYSLGVLYSIWQKGSSDYAQAFANSPAALDFSRVDQPSRSYIIYLEHLYFYGKIHLFSDLVLTNNFLGRYSVGAVNYSSEFMPYLNYSFYFQTYINQNLYLDIGYGVSLMQVYNPLSVSLRAADPVPAKNDFSKKIQVSQNLNIGLGFIF